MDIRLVTQRQNILRMDMGSCEAARYKVVGSESRGCSMFFSQLFELAGDNVDYNKMSTAIIWESHVQREHASNYLPTTGIAFTTRFRRIRGISFA